jgi:hypothetical protein
LSQSHQALQDNQQQQQQQDLQQRQFIISSRVLWFQLQQQAQPQQLCRSCRCA